MLPLTSDATLMKDICPANDEQFRLRLHSVWCLKLFFEDRNMTFFQFDTRCMHPLFFPFGINYIVRYRTTEDNC